MEKPWYENIHKEGKKNKMEYIEEKRGSSDRVINKQN